MKIKSCAKIYSYTIKI